MYCSIYCVQEHFGSVLIDLADLASTVVMVQYGKSSHFHSSPGVGVYIDMSIFI